MNQQSHGQHKAVHPHPGQATGQPDPGKPDAAKGPKPAENRLTAKKNETVLGPFTVRDLTVFASTLILFVASLIPMFASRYNLWNLGSLFFLGLGIILPLIVTALFVARRLTPESKVRIGSLSVDQFASVVASFALAFFFLAVAGAFVPSMLVALIGSLGLFAATVLGRFIPFLAGDFMDRAEVPAHVVARESAAPFRKPSTPKEPKPAKEPGSGTLAGWGKRLTAGAAGRAGAAGGASATGSAVQNGTSPTGASPTGTAHVSAPQTGAGLNGNRPHSGVSAGEAQHGAPQYGVTHEGDGVTHEGAARNTAQPASTQPASVQRGQAQQGSVQQGQAQGSVQQGQEQRASAQTAVATPATAGSEGSAGSAGSGNAAAAAVAAGAAGAAGSSSRTAASPPTQAADVVPPAAGQTHAAAVAPSASAPSSPEPSAAQATQAAAVPAARESATGAGSPASAPAETMLHPQVMSQEPIGATVDPSSRPEEHEDQPVHDAFWFAVAQPRTAVDERTGMPAFVIEPGGWVLALEDRGHEFLVQHTDGRVGLLRDLSNIERG